MKRTITILLAAVFSVGLCFAESWPDGSKMDKWFTIKKANPLIYDLC